MDKIVKNVYFIEIYMSCIKGFYLIDLNYKICIGLFDDIVNNNKVLIWFKICNIILFFCFFIK